VSSNNSIESILKSEGFFLFTGNGSSMWPLIREGRDSLEVRPPSGRLRKYDIALYKAKGLFVAHRVMVPCDGYYVMRGDNCYLRETVKDEDVLGVVVSLWRDEKKVNMRSLSYTLYCFLIINCHGPFLKFCHILRKLNEKD